MKVSRHQLSDCEIEMLQVEEPPNSDHHPGETIGYRCVGCGQADESRAQIWHDEDCIHAGDHGRQYYDSQPSADETHNELDPDHTLFMVRSAETNVHEGVERGSPVMWLCGECFNGDETAAEIVHDEACPLAGRVPV